MKGSEKQIKWAEELIARVVTTLEQAKEVSGDETYNERIDAVKNAAYAWDVIDLFKDYRPCGDVYKDIGKLASIYKMARYYRVSNSQKAILLLK